MFFLRGLDAFLHGGGNFPRLAESIPTLPFPVADDDKGAEGESASALYNAAER